MKRRLERSITFPVVVFIVVLVIVVILGLLWNVVLVNDYRQIRELAMHAPAGGAGFHWALLALGSLLFISVVVLLSVLAAQLFSEIRWNERQQNFIASISHELNSPLSSIKLYAQTLRGEVTPEDRARFLQVILTDVDRLAHLISNIMRAAQEDRLPARPEPVPVAPYLEAYQAEIASQFLRRGRGDEIVLKPVDPELHAMLDRTLFRQVLDNLVDNATKYARNQKTRIEIEALERDRRLVLTVKDDGIGIPKSELRKVFERFYRIEGDSERSRKGTGLGLFIVRSIVTAHEGDVYAESEGKDRGCTFRIELPLAPHSQDEESPAGAPAKAENEEVPA